MDKIIIKSLKLFAYHGVNPEEKENGQNFILDIECFLNLDIPCVSDNLYDTVSYAQIIKTVRKTFLETKYDLIEKAAQMVADCILENFNQIDEVKVILKKPEAPIKADFEYVAVAISRKRNKV
ncbi:MAG: dihydroneopterin aldolase [Clostridiales bacterium]|nr:dihydroneopterin aldolase [Clostridiales bacterium]